jgi:hypothetical protein
MRIRSSWGRGLLPTLLPVGCLFPGQSWPTLKHDRARPEATVAWIADLASVSEAAVALADSGAV